MKHELRRHRSQGFTLVELLTVLAVMTLLAMLAWPAYLQHRLRVQRASAQTVLREAALHLQQVYASHDRYDPPPEEGGLGGATPEQTFLPERLRFAPASSAGAARRPTHSIRLRTIDATSFTLEAIPTTVQAADRCGALTLDQKGAEGASGPDGALACWR